VKQNPPRASLWLHEIANVLVRFNQIASFVKNADHRIM
jgi:hypothetical protein